MSDVKQFSARERSLLLGVKGVGPTVIGRLEQLGYHTLSELAEADTGHIVRLVASMLGSSCWQNSPQLCSCNPLRCITSNWPSCLAS